MNAIYAYSLVRVLYDQGNDYIDTFIPLVVSVVPKEGKLIKSGLQEALNKKYSLFIPLYSLDIILSRSKRYNYLQHRDDGIFLTETGVELQNRTNHYRDVERRINQLSDDAHTYIQGKTGISVDNVSDLILTFVKANLSSFDILLTSEPESVTKHTTNYPLEVEQHLAEYFIMIENSKPEMFNVLQDIILGSIISVSVYSSSFGEINRKFDLTTVYLDTNFILSLFDLRQESFSKPVIELYNMMVESRCFAFRVFDFTLYEVINVLNRFIRDGVNYIDEYPVDSIYSKLKALGWTPSYVTEFISKIDEKLLEKNIFITGTHIDLKNLEMEEGLLEGLSPYKPDQPEISKKHDLLAIKKINEARGGDVRKIEKSKVIFLTSDLKLANYNYEKSHKGRGTINEVIPDRVLTNLLWIKKPKDSLKISIPSVISVYKSDQFISYTIWDKFVKTLKTLRNNGSITDGDIGILLYDRHLGDVLKDFSKGHCGQLDDKFILERIMDVKQHELKSRKEETEKLVGKYQELLRDVDSKVVQLDQLKTVISDTRARVDDAVNSREHMLITLESRIVSIKASLTAKAQSTETIEFNLIRLFLILSVIYLTVNSIFYVKNNWNDLEPTYGLLSASFYLILLLLGIKRKNLSRLVMQARLWRRKKLYHSETSTNQLLAELEGDLNNFRNG